MQHPDINLANYTPNPAATLQALSQGATVGNQLSDNIILRPKQVQAASDQANAQSQQAITAGNVAQAQNSLLPAQTQAASDLIPLQAKADQSGAQVSNQDNQTKLVLGAVKLGVSTDPQFAELFKQHLLNAQAAQTADSGRAATLAIGAQKTAPQEAQTNALNTSTANANADVVNSAANSDANKEAQFNTLTNNAATAAGQSAQAAAPFTNPAVAAAGVEGAQAGAVNAALTQKIGLANTIANGAGGNGQLTPEARQKVIEQAVSKGVPIVDASGAARPFSDITKDYTGKVNVENASKVLEGVRNESQTAQNTLQTYQAIKQILPATSTGGLRSLPAADVINNVAAGWGNRSAQANQQLATFQNQLATDALSGATGAALSERDTAVLKQSYPSTKQSSVVNQQLTTAGILVSQRQVQKSDFYNSLVPTVGAAGADKLWNQYVSSNPIFDPSSSSVGAVAFNKSTLTPTEYLGAVQDPAAASAKMEAKVDPSTVPIFNPRNPSTAPFVADTSGKVFQNPVFWTPILDTHNKVFPAATSPTNNAQRIQTAVTTPISDLLRPKAQ